MKDVVTRWWVAVLVLALAFGLGSFACNDGTSDSSEAALDENGGGKCGSGNDKCDDDDDDECQYDCSLIVSKVYDCGGTIVDENGDPLSRQEAVALCELMCDGWWECAYNCALQYCDKCGCNCDGMLDCLIDVCDP